MPGLFKRAAFGSGEGARLVSTNFARFLQNCSECGRPTSKAYARAHAGKCKGCAEGVPPQRQTPSDEETRAARIIDSGYQAYAREEGHYDQGDY